jgi:hypothetical protein
MKFIVNLIVFFGVLIVCSGCAVQTPVYSPYYASGVYVSPPVYAPPPIVVYTRPIYRHYWR